MTIDSIGSGSVGPQKTQAAQDRDKVQEHGGAASQDALVRADRVEISAVGRSLSEAQDIFETDPARVTQITQNLSEGLYNTPAVAEQIAVRILSEVA